MTDEAHSRKLAATAFGAAMDRYAQTVPADVNAVSQLGASDETIEQLIGDFEATSQVDDDGNEFWFARELQTMLGYAEWEDFLAVVAKAKAACEQAGLGNEDHFAEIGGTTSLANAGEHELEDIALSRYACYLIAQNADSKKQPVAFAQTYFAIQTRRQEIADQEAQEYLPLSEDERRVLLRDEIKTHNRYLASAAKNAGVREGIGFAIFQTEGYKGLYGGLDVPGIRRRKGLTSKQSILDHMGSTELAANLFRATQTADKLQRDGTRSKDQANRTHFEVGRKVRQTIVDIGGVMPEKLPSAEDIKKVGRRLQTAISNSTKPINDGLTKRRS